MGLFDGLRKRWRDAQAARTWRSYVSEADVEAAQSSDSEPVPTRTVRAEFVMVLVHGDDPEAVTKIAGRACDVAIEAGATVENIVGPLVVITYGAPLIERPEPGDHGAMRRDLAIRISRELRESAGVLHGCTEARVGRYGSTRLWSYGCLLRGFPRMLETVAALRPGEMWEWADDAR